MDYSNYTISELRECLRSIDKDTYPDNYQKLLEELNLRKDEIDKYEKSEATEFIVKAEIRLKVLTWLQIATAIAFLYLGITSIGSEQQTWVIILVFGIALLNMLAGYFLFKRKRLGFNISFINQIFQLFSLNLGFVYFSYAGLGALMIVLQDGVALNATLLNPAVLFYWGSNLGFGIGIDLAALFFLVVIASCREEIEQWES